MKKTVILIFLLLTFGVKAQDTLEICEEQSVTTTFFSTSTGNGTNTWIVGGQQYFSDELTYTFTNAGIYNIILHRENGLCYVEESIQITVSKCDGLIYWVPNCFTPDGNEFNQLFGPVMTEGYDINGFEFLIFNRWGEVIWETNDPNGRWDGTYQGKRCTDGVYIWKLTFNILGNDGKITNHGHLTLLK